jgi:hypothetical protein
MYNVCGLLAVTCSHALAPRSDLAGDCLSSCGMRTLTHHMPLRVVPCVCAFRDVANGKYDRALRKFGEAAARDGRRISVRLLHEMNGNW